MDKPIVFMFSGQGSQYYQMGRELIEQHARFKLWMQHCDSIVKPLIGQSLIDLIYSNDKLTPFDELKLSNPALISIEFSIAKILMESKIKPDYLLGYSLGEITAQIISGAITLEEGLLFSIEIAELIKKESPRAGMLAVIDSPEITRQNSELFESCWITAKNFNSNFVVSGLEQNIIDLNKKLLERKIVNQILPVKYGFHTELMHPLESKIRELAKRINFSNGRIETYSALKSDLKVEPTEDHIWNVFRYEIDFAGSITALLEKGDYIFIDAGPSGTLATFVKYIVPPNSSSEYFETINQFGRDIKTISKLKQNLLVAA